MNDDSYIFKILVCGPAAVGKTCLVHRYVDNVFLEDTQSTIGVDFSLKNIHIEAPGSDSDDNRDLPNQGIITLQIWDLAGEEAFREILPYYVQGSHGILFVFDIAENPDSLVELQDWVDFIKPLLPEVPCVLISTKHDLKPTIPSSEVTTFSKKNDFNTYYETSSKKNKNVHEAFVSLAKMVVATDQE
ncbi:MAG: Rab family GTPase [Candidatus Odinarchaeota archaeon]